MSILAQTVPTVPGSATSEAANAEQHLITRSLAMHLLPGVFIFVLFVVLAPLFAAAGLPSLMALIPGALAGLAFQLADMLYRGKQRNGIWSLEGIVQYRQGMPLWQYFVLVPAFTIAAFLIYGITSPLGAFLLSLFPWLPEWFEVRNVAMLAQYPRSTLVVLFGLTMLVNGIIAPIVEEMYFRGYLMARLSRYGRWAPVLETVLFTLYHFWQPYYWVTQFFAFLPIAASVAWKRNVKLGILSHAALNIIGGLLTFGQLLG